MDNIKNKYIEIIVLTWVVLININHFNFLFYVFIFFFFLFNRRSINFKITKNENLILFLYIIISLISLFYTDNIIVGLKQIEKKIPLLAYLLYAFQTQKLPLEKGKILKAFLYGCLISVLLGLVLLFNDFANGDLVGRYNVYGFKSIKLIEYLSHRSYIGINLLMAIPIILYSIRDKINRDERVTMLGLFILLCLSIIISGGRSIILTLFIELTILLVLLAKKRIKIILFSFILISIPLILILNNVNRLGFTYYLVESGKKIENIEPRINIWRSSIQIIKEHPIFGVGMGDYKDELDLKYEKLNYYEGLFHQYNAHNQYLQILIETGVLGLFFFLWFLIYLFKSNHRADKFIIYFLIIFGFNLFFESYLLRNAGVFFLVFWLFYFNSSGKAEVSLSLFDRRIFNIGLSLFFIFFGLIILILVASKYDSNNPKSYMIQDYRLVEINKSNVDSAISQDLYGAVINEQNTDFLFDYRGKFIANPIKQISNKTNYTVSFNLLVYIPTNSTASEFCIYVWNYLDIMYRVNYNMNKKGTWQNLNLCEYNIDGPFDLGYRLDINSDINIKGDWKDLVIIAKPEYSINENNK